VSVPANPVTKYADTAVGRIAYQVVGDGNPDLLVLHPLLFPIDHMWDELGSTDSKGSLGLGTCSQSHECDPMTPSGKGPLPMPWIALVPTPWR
jgi:hypothetical protein